MNINGWKFDPSVLPEWDVRSQAEVKDYLFESSHSDNAVLIYSEVHNRGEVRYWGQGAVYENKKSPELLLSIRYLGFYPYSFFSTDGNLIFLKAFTRYGIRFVLVLNLAEKAFAIFNYGPPNINYKVEDKGEGFFELVFDEEELAVDSTLEAFNRTEIDCGKLIFKSWTALSEGGDLNIQERGLKYFFANKKKIWNDSLEKFKLGGMSPQLFVDLNRDMPLYYINVFKVDEYGHTKLLALENPDVGGKFFPVFTTLEGCIEFLRRNKIESKIFRSRMKNIMKMMDRGYPLHRLGMVIDPYGYSISLPRGLRVTPKCLRY